MSKDKLPRVWLFIQGFFGDLIILSEVLLKKK